MNRINRYGTMNPIDNTENYVGEIFSSFGWYVTNPTLAFSYNGYRTKCLIMLEIASTLCVSSSGLLTSLWIIRLIL
jgi:hypothetical protein